MKDLLCTPAIIFGIFSLIEPANYAIMDRKHVPVISSMIGGALGGVVLMVKS